MWYATYLGEEEITIDGVKTGQTARQYSDPVLAHIAVSACAGEAEVGLLGSELDFTRTMTSTQRLPINEYSQVWIDKTPADGGANYEVKRAAFGLNQHVWALKRIVGE